MSLSLSLFVSFCLFLCLFVSFCLFLSLVVAVLILTAPLLFLFSFSMCVCMFLFSSLFAQLTPTSSSYGRQGGWGDSGRCVWVDGGWSHSLAVTECGHAYSWGCGADGRLGIGCYSDQLVPAYVRLYGNEQRRRRDDGGGGGGGVREYDGGRMEEEEEDLAYCLTEIEPCMDHEDDPVVRVAAGYAHSTFLTRAGLLYTAVRWGCFVLLVLLVCCVFFSCFCFLYVFTECFVSSSSFLFSSDLLFRVQGCGVSGQLARFEIMADDENGKIEQPKESTETKSTNNSATTAAAAAAGEEEGEGEGVGIDHRFIPVVVSLVPRPMRWKEDHTEGEGRRGGRREGLENQLSNKKIVEVACGDHHTGKFLFFFFFFFFFLPLVCLFFFFC